MAAERNFIAVKRCILPLERGGTITLNRGQKVTGAEFAKHVRRGLLKPESVQVAESTPKPTNAAPTSEVVLSSSPEPVKADTFTAGADVVAVTETAPEPEPSPVVPDTPEADTSSSADEGDDDAFAFSTLGDDPLEGDDADASSNEDESSDEDADESSDEEVTFANVDSVAYKHLVAACKSAGLKASGKADALRKRLRAHLKKAAK